MGDHRHRLATLAAVLLLAAGLPGGLMAGAPNAAAGGPPDDPGSQGQDQGKDDEKRPDHAGQNGGEDAGGGEDQGSSSGDEDGSEDEGNQDDGSTSNKGNGPPDDKGNGASEDEDDGGSDDGETGSDDEDDDASEDKDDGSSQDEDAGSDDQEEDEAPSPGDQTDPERSEEQAQEDDQGDDPLREPTTTEDPEPVELPDGQAPLVAPIIEPAVPEVGQLVHLDAGAWDPDGEIVAIDWFLPDGTWLIGAQVSHVFELPGNHTLELVVTDGQGYTTTVTVDVPVLPATTPTSEDVPTADDEGEATWETGTDADDPLRSSDVGNVGGGSDPLTETSPSPDRPATDGSLAVMAVIAAFLVAAAALVIRVE